MKGAVNLMTKSVTVYCLGRAAGLCHMWRAVIIDRIMDGSEKPTKLESNLPQRHLIHHGSYAKSSGFEPEFPQWEFSV
jgi:hypothetical protein